MSKTRTTVATAVSRVITDDNLPDSIKSGVINALFKNGDIVDHIKEEYISSIGTRAERMYDYADGGGYAFGSPTGEFASGLYGANNVKNTLEFIEGSSVTLDYTHYGPPNSLHIGWLTLCGSHGYNPESNELGVLSTAKSTAVYLDNMIVVVPEAELESLQPESLDQWGPGAKGGFTPERLVGTPATRALILPSPVETQVGGTEHVRVEYIWVEDGELQRGSFNISVAGYSKDTNYFHAKYLHGGTIKYWMYADNSGTYPILDMVFNKPHESRSSLSSGSFFPFAYFRFDGISEIATPYTLAYQTNKKLVKYLGMDYDTVSAAFHLNPDISNVTQIMTMMGVPANTTNPIENRYLFSFFETLYNSTEYNGNRFSSKTESDIDQAWRETLGLKPGLIIKDSRFKLSIHFNGMYKRRVSGAIGAIGTYDSIHGPFQVTVPAVDGVTGEATAVVLEAGKHTYRHQVSKRIYEEIQVIGLRTVYWTLGNYRQAVGENDEPILLIPIDRFITEEYSLHDRETLYARSLHYVFNSVEITHLAWYQSSLFQFLIVAASVFVTVWSLGTSTPLLASLLAAGAYGAAASVVLIGLLEYLMTYVGFTLFVKAVGTEIAFAVAIIAALAGMAGYMTTGGLAGTPWTQQLLTLSTGLTNYISSDIHTDMQDLIGEAKLFSVYQDEQLKLLETARELLNGANRLSPFVIFGESPMDYYNRTVHSGNIGVVGIEAVSSYVAVQLRLPDLNDSIGDTIYE